MQKRRSILAMLFAQFVVAAAMAAEPGAGAKVANDAQPGVVIDRLLAAIARRDVPATMDCFSSGKDVTVVGSETGEHARGREAVTEFFTRAYARSGPYRFVFPTREFTLHGDTAWMFAEGTVAGPGESTGMPYRLTAVLVREAGGYRVELWSGSEPVAARH